MNKKGYKWNPDMDYRKFCDINHLPFYSEDVSNLFNELTNEYVEEEFENQSNV